MPGLPSNASTDSRERYRLAERLVEGCPPELGREMALVGSASRGVSDRYSRIELAVWADPLPDVHYCCEWLRDMGADSEPFELLSGNGGFRIRSWYRGLYVDAVWQHPHDTDLLLRRVLEGQTSDHRQMICVWQMVHAISLRRGSGLARWHEALQRYPDALQSRIIKDAISHWGDTLWRRRPASDIWSLVSRGSKMALSARLTTEVQTALRVLWASNRCWEPDWNWLSAESKRLRRQPPSLVEQINAIFTLADPRASVLLCLELMLEVLDLVPPPFDVSLQKATLTEALDPEPFLKAGKLRT